MAAQRPLFVLSLRIANQCTRTLPLPILHKRTKRVSLSILEYVAENPETTIPELAEITGVSTRSVERNIKKLQDAGKLRRVGPAKGGHWKVLG